MLLDSHRVCVCVCVCIVVVADCLCDSILDSDDVPCDHGVGKARAFAFRGTCGCLCCVTSSWASLSGVLWS